MVQYTFAQAPEVILDVPGKDSSKARNLAMEQLFNLMDEGQVAIELPDNFGPQQFIEVKELAPVTTGEEDTINQAIQVLSNLATLKLKVQESRSEALRIRSKIDILFTDNEISEEESAALKEGFKALKTFAQMNLRYREARAQAEDARSVLDRALQSPESSPEPASETE